MTIHINKQEELISCLRSTQIGLMAFDTIWGLTGTCTEQNVTRLHHIKQRTPQNPFLIIIGHTSWLNRLVAPLSYYQQMVINQLWPGPITLIMKRKTNPITSVITAGKDTVAIRYPNWTPLQAFLTQLNEPLLSTILDISTPTPVLIREGAITKKEIENKIGPL